MRVAAVLALYAVLLAVVPARVLARAAWPSRCPRGGIALWQALSASALLAAAGAGLALALPALRFSGDLSAVLRECAKALRAQYAAPAGWSPQQSVRRSRRRCWPWPGGASRVS